MCTLEQVYFEDLSIFCAVHHSLNPGLSPIPAETPLQYDAVTTMLHHREGISQMMGGTWFIPGATLEIHDI